MRYSTPQNTPTILCMWNGRDSPATCCFSQLKAAEAAEDHLPLFSCGNIQKAMQNICDCSEVERVIKTPKDGSVKRGKETNMKKLSRQKIKGKEKATEKEGLSEKMLRS